MAKIKYYSHITETTTGSTMSAYFKKKLKWKRRTWNLEIMRQNFGSTPLIKWKRLGSKVVNATNLKAWKSEEADPISSSNFFLKKNENKTLIKAPAKTKQNQTEHTKHELHRCLLQDDMSKTWEVMTQIKTSKTACLRDHYDL